MQMQIDLFSSPEHRTAIIPILATIKATYGDISSVRAEIYIVNEEMGLLEHMVLRPARAGARVLNIVSGYASAKEARAMLELLRNENLMDVQVHLYIGMVRGGMNRYEHDAMVELTRAYNFMAFYTDMEVHSKIFVWMDGGLAFVGSANASDEAFQRSQCNTMIALPSKLIEFEVARFMRGAVTCLDPQIKQRGSGGRWSLLTDEVTQAEARLQYLKSKKDAGEIVLRPKGAPMDIPVSRVPVITQPPVNSLAQSNVNPNVSVAFQMNSALVVPAPGAPSLTLTLLSKNGKLGRTSSLNWGVERTDRSAKNRDSAYIPMSSKLGSNFLPTDDFKVVTHDGLILVCKWIMRSGGGQFIETPKDTSIMGRWFRDVLRIPYGTPVTVELLRYYGRTDVIFYRCENADGVYFLLDFSRPSGAMPYDPAEAMRINDMATATMLPVKRVTRNRKKATYVVSKQDQFLIPLTV